ncbi:PLP-dependent aminotransferase family protein [Phenylobacterium aquaticum]|uniref:aminotransferase-like domain-containing protein n=1 Tax=Phenylobacterium aquaticum TaxID=1763816 RepID=UPI0026ED3958|nr:PLP-dependent aminotransferase family protein [Phenylobacterium aquaticum]
MAAVVFYLDPASPQTLQSQLRQRIIDAIVSASLEPGVRMPSSRRLSRDLDIARNTVTLVYQQLVADGYLSGRERSGVFVSDALFEAVRPGRDRASRPVSPSAPWRARLQAVVRVDVEGRPPPSWELNPYPFLDGAYDASLSPGAEWRDAVRSTLQAQEFAEWSQDGGEADDPRLIHEIRTKVLPRRGLQATSEEVLVVGGRREAFSLLARALVGRGAPVAVEEPGPPDLTHLLRLQGADIIAVPVDAQGMVVDERLGAADLVFVTPACQLPTGARLSSIRCKALLDRAEQSDLLVVEYDLAASGGFADQAAPALRSMDRGGRVIYVADLCDVLSPGLGLGFIVGDADLIRELRRLRTLVSGPAPRAAQRTAAFFLSLGHYDAILGRQHRTLHERLNALRDALNYHLPQLVAIDPRANGSAIWVEGPPDLSARQLANEAAKRGVLIEPADRFYSTAARAENCFRMGVTGIPRARIREGVAVLAQVVQSLTQPRLDRLDPARPTWLAGGDLQALIAGAKLLCRTAYGDPYEVDVLPDGRLVGKAGYAHEDCDVGAWWMEGDYWCRRWTEWSYGETARFLTVVEGDQIRWYRDDHLLFNRGIIKPLAALSDTTEVENLAP